MYSNSMQTYINQLHFSFPFQIILSIFKILCIKHLIVGVHAVKNRDLEGKQKWTTTKKIV